MFSRERTRELLTLTITNLESESRILAPYARSVEKYAIKKANVDDAILLIKHLLAQVDDLPEKEQSVE